METTSSLRIQYLFCSVVSAGEMLRSTPKVCGEGESSPPIVCHHVDQVTTPWDEENLID